MDTRAERSSYELFVSVEHDQKSPTTCDESLSVQRVQPKDILRSQECLQHYHGHFVLMRRLLWIFFEIESPDGTKITFCNMVCWGTLYQLCIPILDKTAATVSKCITERWVQYHLSQNYYSYERNVLELLFTVMFVIFLRPYCFGINIKP